MESSMEGAALLFDKFCVDNELLAKVIEALPYPVQVFTPDGYARYINQATLDLIGIKTRESHVGIYNVFEDPAVRDFGVTENIREVLKGKTVHIDGFHASYRELMKFSKLEDRDVQTISSDITCFPILNSSNEVIFFAAVFVFNKLYSGKVEIIRGRQYIENNWLEPFNAEKAAKAACLSKAHFSKLFKKQMGVTPYRYYIDYKIKMLKEKLLDSNLSVSQAFAECNLDYNGHYSGLFKEKVGVSPSEYRKINK